MARAEEESLACDLFLAIGSSLVVYPAAGFPILAKRNGATLVILNREPTELDPLADHARIAGPTTDRLPADWRNPWPASGRGHGGVSHG